MGKQISFYLTERQDDFLHALIKQKSCDFMSCKACAIAEIFNCNAVDDRKIEVVLAEFILDHAKKKKNRT
jgi:hypothetical protein